MDAPANFFELQSRGVAKPRAAAARPAANPTNGPPLTVAQLTARIDRAIRTQLPQGVRVQGEISNFKRHSQSGHCYFTLKDSAACLDCVMFRDHAQRQKFDPADGLSVVAGGEVKIFASRGRYQLYVDTLQPVGQGALELAFRQLRTKLEAEGLFAAGRKRPLPNYPRRIAMVTGTSAAALHDMLKVLRRFAFLELAVFAVPVQGEGAAPRIAAALLDLNRSDWRPDVILLARGGGSLEDLWAFNEEAVARAIAASRVPIVTGIGHEVDTSIADLAADHHAHTPTEAAQVVSAHWRTAAERLADADRKLGRGVADQLAQARQRLSAIARHECFRRPFDLVNVRRQSLDEWQTRFANAVQRSIARRRATAHQLEVRLLQHNPRHALRVAMLRLDAAARRADTAIARLVQQRRADLRRQAEKLEALSPDAVLRRGYTITTRAKDGQLIRSAADLRAGDRILTRLADGTVKSTVGDAAQLPLFE